MSDLINLTRPNGFSVKKNKYWIRRDTVWSYVCNVRHDLRVDGLPKKNEALIIMKHSNPVRRRSSQTQCVKALGEKTKIIAMCCSRGSKCAKAKDV